MLPPEEEQVCFSACLKIINNLQLRGKVVLSSWSLGLRACIAQDLGNQLSVALLEQGCWIR